MHRLGRNLTVASGLLVLILAWAGDVARAQDKPLREQVLGTWMLVSNENVAPDGTKRQLFGPSPKGILILDAGGRYAQIMINPDRPKFKAKTRLEGTPEENKAVVQATAAQFGSWKVDEAKRTIVFHIDFHIFPNDDNTDSARAITIAGDEMRYSNPAPSGGGRSELVWRRAK